MNELKKQLHHKDWEKRHNSLLQLQELVRSVGDGSAGIPTSAWTDRILADLGSTMVPVLKELRSAIMKEARALFWLYSSAQHFLTHICFLAIRLALSS